MNIVFDEVKREEDVITLEADLNSCQIRFIIGVGFSEEEIKEQLENIFDEIRPSNLSRAGIDVKVLVNEGEVTGNIQYMGMYDNASLSINSYTIEWIEE